MIKKFRAFLLHFMIINLLLILNKKLNFLNSELSKNLLFLTERRLSNVQISNKNLIKTINNLDPNKCPWSWYDQYSNDETMRPFFICKLLPIIFKSCLSQMKFPMEWKKANVVPIHTKKMIISASKITDLSLCFRSAVRSLKDFYLTNCTSF